MRTWPRRRSLGEAELARVQRRIGRAPSGRSRSVLLEGPGGVGRTRLLDACLLSATLAGHTVVRCDSDDASSGDYGVARAIARQLFELMPGLAREAATPWLESLQSVLPESVAPRAPSGASSVLRATLQQSLQAWLTALSQHQRIVLAVDDFHLIEPSAAFLALLEGGELQHDLLIILSAKAGSAWTAMSAHKLLTGMTTIKLAALSAASAETLLCSLFGAVPNLGSRIARMRCAQAIRAI